MKKNLSFSMDEESYLRFKETCDRLGLKVNRAIADAIVRHEERLRKLEKEING